MKISVVIPCYNRASVVADTIQCVLNQTHAPAEIIAVDDGSTDNTVEVLESFGPRLIIVRQKNGGPSAARNAGLARATGDFVWFMDSDDLASLNKLEVQCQAVQTTGADIALSPWIKCRLEQRQARPETHVLQQHGLPRNLARALVCDWTIVLQTALFRRSLLSRVGGFDKSYMVAEDQLLFLKCLLSGAQVVHTPDCVVFYRTEGVNKLTSSGCAAQRRFVDWARFVMEGARLCAEAGDSVSGRFLYRLRLWGAWQDLRSCNSEAAARLMELIARQMGSEQPPRGYYVAQKCFQWLGGIRQRIFGDRSPFSLKAGPMSRRQVALLAELGLSLKN